MREYLFRGKLISNNQWVEGSLVNNLWHDNRTGNPICYILYGEVDSWDDIDSDYEKYEVIPASVGQYSCGEDRIGTKIFEGDIVKVDHNIMPVVFEKGCFYTPHKESRYRVGGWATESIEVVGNIFDNANLIQQ